MHLIARSDMTFNAAHASMDPHSFTANETNLEDGRTPRNITAVGRETES